MLNRSLDIVSPSKIGILVRNVNPTKYWKTFGNILFTALLWNQIGRSQSLCLVSDFPDYCCALRGFPDKWR